ncbi:MAG: ion transporter [Desulfuromonas sp.]|nr:ion transporter [Desulfuromonas sp.]
MDQTNRFTCNFIDFFLGQQGLWAFIFLLFLAQLLGPTIDSPLVRLLTALLFSLFMIAGVFSLSQRPVVRILAALLVFAAIVLRWLRLALPTSAIIAWGLTASLLFMIFLTLASVDRVFRDDGAVTGKRVTGAVAVYLLFGLTFAYLYSLLDQLLPGAFSLPASTNVNDPTHQESFTYFSFITLTTLGYGDITPVHPAARMCVAVQALFGQLYPATLLARLVSLEITNRQGSKPLPTGEKR